MPRKKVDILRSIREKFKNNHNNSEFSPTVNQNSSFKFTGPDALFFEAQMLSQYRVFFAPHRLDYTADEIELMDDGLATELGYKNKMWGVYEIKASDVHSVFNILDQKIKKIIVDDQNAHQAMNEVLFNNNFPVSIIQLAHEYSAESSCADHHTVSLFYNTIQQSIIQNYMINDELI
ncbi:MAG: hypothetical protein EP298_03270 [Gammaproteobacteria bacterium]|nr:MAG: hypothetical protein EP298_03270 [Gammaproteobacteria bacterium]UTW43554.1 hypothetical protein KFE69_05545 [bacterium SCSIO 12844]